MLKASIAFSDLGSEVHLQDGNLRFGNSNIQPYRHRSLETRVFQTQGQWFAVVRERLAGSPPAPAPRLETVDAERFHDAYREALLWPLDYLVVEVAQAGGRIKLRAGAFGIAPVYFRASEAELAISYDLADFFSGPCVLDPGVISRRLGMHADYSARQICAGVLMLTERAMLFARPGELRYQYPAAMDPPTPSREPLQDGGVSLFEDYLDRSVAARPVEAGNAAVELSGGMDSAAVACALARHAGKVVSLGIRLDDQKGQQAARRAAVVGKFGLSDHTVDMHRFPPSIDLRPASARVEYPLADFYLEAFEALWDTAQSLGCDTVYTGVGGDQLFPLYQDETQPDLHGDTIVLQARRRAEDLLTPRALAASRALPGLDPPPGPLQASVLASNMCQSPHLLKRGLWPISPLGDPTLAAHCQRLPLSCRLERETMRRYLQAAIGDNVFAAGYAKETFAHVLPPLLAGQASRIAAQLKECALADMGLVDRSAVLTLLDDMARTRARPLTAPLASFLWMERFVRQFA